MLRDSWNILIVDDEHDIHEITTIALKRKKWRNKGLNVLHAYSAQEAKTILKEHDSVYFEVALIDVVMETDDAGLDLCKFIRDHLPNSVRIILRTGQAGKAPEEQVLNDYDIDHYLAKTDATPERLFALIRSCIHSSQDLLTLKAFGQQMKSLVQSLPSARKESDLLLLMEESLMFLDIKHTSRTLFFYNIDGKKLLQPHIVIEHGLELDKLYETLTELHKDYKNYQICYDYKTEESGDIWKIALFQTPCRQEIIAYDIPEKHHRKGALVFRLKYGFTQKYVIEYLHDATLFLENWCMASESIRLQNEVENDKILREKMYYERLEGIATMVTGVAHEMNTPLGVAMTSNRMIQDLAQELLTAPDSDKQDIVNDFTHSCSLLEKNIVRAQDLIKSFKQLSSGQLTDHYDEFDITSIIKDCIESMSPELRKKQINVRLQAESENNDWKGYASHLSQVIINMIQNIIRYAYKECDNGGEAEIIVNHINNTYIIEIEDYGSGMSPDTLKCIFDPFFTTGRKDGGTGLGLAISQNIVTNLLDGKIKCESELNKGTKFKITLPSEVKKH
ncbi:ATP-binding protein [Candidatus Magnetominusculus dajiuhuensis]|uniref:ATP-binding protein n=1 Tax=Candidatus Magnetominusculus dajiuhuensis TaxID=3137712 RepID=UPI003B42D110